jgi:hypothetical protein
VRILSETASAKLATPVTIKYEDLRNGLGYDVRKESANFSPVWLGGEWRLRDITNYMTSAAFSLLKHAADNRRAWLSRFYAIGRQAVRPRKKGELYGFLFDQFSLGGERFRYGILERAGVEVTETDDGALVKLAQPYGAFAEALIESQKYPDLKDENGNPIPPYDVTAHTLSLLFGDLEIKPVRVPYKIKKPTWGSSGPDYGPCREIFERNAIYKSSIPVMDEGWTRYVFEDMKDRDCVNYSSITDKEIRADRLEFTPSKNALPPFPKNARGKVSFKTIIFPDQSGNQMLNGYAKGTMPDEYTGGLGKEGVKNLRNFVEAGGTLIFLNRASDFAIENFGLPVRDATKGLPRKDFYIPGSILRTEINVKHKIAKEMPKESIAWFEDSPVFEITTSDDTNVEIVARYPQNPKDILLSGWALGAEKIAGKAALVSINIGKGKIVLFGFRPQYRAQSLATYRLFFNAISE